MSQEMIRLFCERAPSEVSESLPWPVPPLNPTWLPLSFPCEAVTCRIGKCIADVINGRSLRDAGQPLAAAVILERIAAQHSPASSVRMQLWCMAAQCFLEGGQSFQAWQCIQRCQALCEKSPDSEPPGSRQYVLSTWCALQMQDPESAVMWARRAELLAEKEARGAASTELATLVLAEALSAVAALHLTARREEKAIRQWLLAARMFRRIHRTDLEAVVLLRAGRAQSRAGRSVGRSATVARLQKCIHLLSTDCASPQVQCIVRSAHQWIASNSPGRVPATVAHLN